MTKQQKVLLGIMGVLVFFMFYKYVYGPLGIKLKKVKDELVTKQARLTIARARANRLDQLKTDYELLKIKVAEAEKKLPREKEIPRLLRDITSAGRKFKIDIADFRPRKEEQQEYYVSHPFLITLDTSYHNLAYFLAEIGQYERIFHIKNLGLTPILEKENKLKGVAADFQLYTYTFKEKKEEEEKIESKK
ncbi:MAG: type 4a pilus biogenesis protein PilO [Elusimicrobiota bacterium]|nr:type 4a pilus biogenesis protein PilO [Elusimicrobiota bacterium]